MPEILGIVITPTRPHLNGPRLINTSLDHLQRGVGGDIEAVYGYRQPDNTEAEAPPSRSSATRTARSSSTTRAGPHGCRLTHMPPHCGGTSTLSRLARTCSWAPSSSSAASTRTAKCCPCAKTSSTSTPPWPTAPTQTSTATSPPPASPSTKTLRRQQP